MSEYIKIILKLTWVILLLYWVVSGFKVKRAQTKEPAFQRFMFYWLPLLIALLLLGPGDWFGRTWLREQFIEHTDAVGLVGLFFCVPGAIIAIWSRYLLGKNWSLSVQKKADHELIQTGPYQWVRHPIYTGLLFMFIGNGIIVGDYRAIIAVLLVAVSLWFKLKKEEGVLIAAFGIAYEEYRDRTKALIPFVI